MKRIILTALLLLTVLTTWAGSKITRKYIQSPLSEVLIDIDKASPELHISFIYNKLEDYPVTCTVSNASPMDAIHQVIGFYPVKVTRNGKNVNIEPIFDTENKLSGRIVDEQGKPLEFANVSLFSLGSGRLIAGGVSNANGDFVIPCDEGRVLLKASFVGYKTEAKECAVGDVGIIRLKEDAIKLAEVRKNGTRPLARMERGALVYDMPLLLSLLPADNAYEAITHIPGVSDVNGYIDFAGQAVTLVINGKSTTLSSEQVVERLKQMPADRLAKCEVMMSAPARYHARGAVINIVTRDLYGQNQLSGQLQGAGVFSKKNYGYGSGSLLLVHGKLSLDASYNLTGGDKYAKATHEAIQPLATGPQRYWDVNQSFSNFKRHNLYAQLELALAPKHRLGVAYNGTWSNSRNHNIAEGTNPSEQMSTTRNYINNVDVSYETPVGLKLGASYMHFKYPQQQHLDNLLQSDRQDYFSESGQDIDKWTFTADQSHTLSHEWTLNYGAEMKLTKNESWQETHLPTGQPVEEASGSVGYSERISNLYSSLSKEWSKVSAEVGVQAENYHTPQWNEWSVYPTMNLLWKANAQNMLNLSFSSNSSYPSYWSLMNSVYYSSSYSEIWGNPSLKPMKSYVLSLMWRFRQRYSLTAVYQYDDNFFAQLPYQPSDRMAVVMQEINFNSRHELGLVASAQWKIGRWANGSLGGFYGMFRDKCDNFHDIPFNRLGWSGRIYGTAAVKPFDKHNLTLTLQPIYQFRTIQGVYDIHEFFHLNISLRWTDKSGRLSATLSGKNLTNFHFQTTDTWQNQNFSMSVYQDWRNIQLALTYRIGNYKAKKRKEMDTSRMGH